MPITSQRVVRKGFYNCPKSCLTCQGCQFMKTLRTVLHLPRLPMPLILRRIVLKAFGTALKVASSSDWLRRLPVQLISPRDVLKALSTVLKFVWPHVRLSIKQKQSESLNTCSAESASSPLDNNYRDECQHTIWEAIHKNIKPNYAHGIMFGIIWFHGQHEYAECMADFNGLVA